MTDDTRLPGGPKVLDIGTMGWGALAVAHDCHIPARGSEVETTIERQKTATFLMFSLFLTGWEKPKVLRRIPDTGTGAYDTSSAGLLQDASSVAIPRAVS